MHCVWQDIQPQALGSNTSVQEEMPPKASKIAITEWVQFIIQRERNGDESGVIGCQNSQFAETSSISADWPGTSNLSIQAHVVE